MKSIFGSTLLSFSLFLGFAILSGCNLDQGYSPLGAQSLNTSIMRSDSSANNDGGVKKPSSSSDDSAEDIHNEYEALCYCRDYGSALVANAPATVDALVNVSGSLSIAAKSIGKITNHNGSIKILAEKVEGISINDGRVRIVAPAKATVVVGDVEKIHGSVVICGRSA
ncbi:MAG: hypothetical protein AABZ55_11225, partial [Bdellovibrionota bacterium]